MNLAQDCLEKAALRIPNRPAIIDFETAATITYSELNGKVNAIANALISMGIEKGDRVAVYLPNIPQYVMAVLAIMKVGAVYVPFNIMNKRLEIEYGANHCGARVLFGATEQTLENVIPIWDQLTGLEKIVLVEDVPADLKSERILDFDDLLAAGSDEFTCLEMDPDDAVSILYTSGTTGRPKGAVATHRNWYELTMISAYQVVPMTDEDKVVCGYPFFHVALVIAVLPTLFVGAAVITIRRFTPEVALTAITKLGASHFMGAPTMWTYLIDEYDNNQGKYDLSSLWQGQSAGAALPAETCKRIEETFGVGIVECYGATECSSTVTHSRFGHPTPGSAGWPTPEWEIKIIDDDGNALPNGEIGELCCKGPGVIKEYWNDPEMSAARLVDGWWHSGDMAYMENGGATDGQLYIVDRKDDMVICGGYNIYPLEVENYITQHENVLQAIVVGISDAVKGQVPKAFIVLEKGESATADELEAYCRDCMAAYKVPRSFEFVTLADLPQTASGKVLKREIRRLEEEKLNA
ncbi:MAG: AMP-binding protein [Rhodospirillaceae bacterium]|jgi:long-chain acyl-CoA synthetase|nr:AMP-binding protein [Rhodospirillaceae bacterium]MBT3885536.1 AMP-binding protein [Rhodospirillaceae bacterium]MBT4117931.1 AMP-binding protein [Rhodospirillaceae bacterium]MBT4671595.1 AMP-binding protein [Rhodospirillaceae bacterium]MBT4718900.1 AMP-binding protein [Rhodospirillaceae bacterium]